jgi:penicillin-insensitive murein endopeptidase
MMFVVGSALAGEEAPPSEQPKRAATHRAKQKRVARVAPRPQPSPPAVSVGSPNDGRLDNGAHLDTKRPYLRVVPAYASADTRWGLPELVNLVDRAARGVAKRFPGSVLDVGDMSRRGGGDIQRHHSHESGRDIDLGFYALDAKGKQVHARTFIRFEDGAAKSTNVAGADFDLARNWLLVELLVSEPAAHVSHIFIAEPLRQRLLAYGRAHASSRRVLDNAAIAMLQPVSSLPHDDHMHVRISCPASMHAACIEYSKNAPIGRLAGRRHARRGATARVQK